jgi:hypothetical protein
MSNDIVWSKIPGFEGYEVSSVGAVRSYMSGGQGLMKNPVPKYLKSFKSKDGYTKFSLYVDGKLKRQGAHRLIALAFLGGNGSGMDAAHIDGNKDHNFLWNIKWCTRKENDSHKDLHGTRVKGERSASAKLTETDVKTIVFAHEKLGETQTALAKLYKISSVAISDIIIGKSWVHVTHKRRSA